MNRRSTSGGATQWHGTAYPTQHTWCATPTQHRHPWTRVEDACIATGYGSVTQNTHAAHTDTANSRCHCRTWWGGSVPLNAWCNHGSATASGSSPSVVARCRNRSGCCACRVRSNSRHSRSSPPRSDPTVCSRRKKRV